MYIYIYIYRERERDIDIYVYTYTGTFKNDRWINRLTDSWMCVWRVEVLSPVGMAVGGCGSRACTSGSRDANLAIYMYIQIDIQIQIER